jgi:hypothetical protein
LGIRSVSVPWCLREFRPSSEHNVTLGFHESKHREDLVTGLTTKSTRLFVLGSVASGVGSHLASGPKRRFWHGSEPKNLRNHRCTCVGGGRSAL